MKRRRLPRPKPRRKRRPSSRDRGRGEDGGGGGARVVLSINGPRMQPCRGTTRRWRNAPRSGRQLPLHNRGVTKRKRTAAGKPAKDRAGEAAAAAVAADPGSVRRERPERKDRSKAASRPRPNEALLPPMTRTTAEEPHARRRRPLEHKRVRPSQARSSRNRQGKRPPTFRANRRRRAAGVGGSARMRTKCGARARTRAPALPPA